MTKTIKLKQIATALGVWLLFAAKSFSQDVSISLSTVNFPVVQGTNGVVAVTICNTNTSGVALATDRIRPLISFPSGLTATSVVASSLPSGWTVVSNTGQSIRLSNGTDAIPANTCRVINLQFTGVNIGGPSTVTSTMAFNGPQTPGNVTSNDNATSLIRVVLIKPLAENASISTTTGGVAIANVLANDSTNGVPSTFSNSTISQSGTWASGISLNTSTGAISVAAGTTPGVYNVVYQLCDQLTPVSCATVTNTITVLAPFVVSNSPNPNIVTTPPNTPITNNPSLNPVGGTQPYTYSGVDVNNTPTTSSKKGGTFSVNPTTGQYTYTPPTGLVGVDSFYIRVCDASTPSSCATQLQIVNVSNPFVVSNAPTPNNIVTMPNTPVVGNPSLNPVGGIQPYSYNVVDENNNPTTGSKKGGTISINPTTGQFNYTPPVGYVGNDTFYVRVCDASVPPICATQMQVVSVSAVISAVTENGSVPTTGGVAVANVRANDLVNGLAATSSNSTISQSGTWPAGITLNTTTGAINVAAGTAIGNYPVVYQLCDNLTPANCATVTDTIKVLQVPDLTPTTDIDDLNFAAAGVGRDMVLNVYEINGAAHVNGNSIVIKVRKVNGFDITYSAASGTSNVMGGVANSNSDWTITEDATFITITAKAGTTIPANGVKRIGLTVTRKVGVPINSTQSITATILFGASGETANSNNIVETAVTAN